MTQAVTNNLNNIQELMTQANQLQNKVAEAKNFSATDKGTNKLVDFAKVYEKQVKTENKNTSTSENETNISDIKTIADLKNSNIASSKDNNWADFQAILSKITEESNAETSLDLTLARDIDEIISQLKKAIDETIDETEDVVEQTEVVEELTSQIDSEEFIAEDLTTDEEADCGAKNEKVIPNETVQELLSYVNKNYLNEDFSESKNNLNLEEQSSDFNTLESNFETLEMFNNLSADDISKTSQTDDTNQNELENLLEEDLLKELNIESIKAEVDTSGEDSLMNSQTPQEQAVKAMLNTEIETFDLKIDKTTLTSAQQAQPTPSKPIDINPSKILDQITKQLEGLQNNSKVNIVLNPESLGKVTIQLIKTGEGLSAQFTVANQEVRDMLMKGLDGLKETLTAHGVGVDNVSVKMNETQKSEYNADWTEQDGSRGGNKEQGRSNREEKEKGLFEQMMAQTLEEENGNV